MLTEGDWVEMVRESLTISQLARHMGLSRVAVWNKVKKGRIPARKIGSQYVIDAHDANVALGNTLTDDARAVVHRTVGRVIKQYGPVLKRLSRE